MEYFNKFSKVVPRKGDLLLSEPLLPDPNFERSVIFLCEHNEDGAFGFIVNKASQLSFADVMEWPSVLDNDSPVLYIGGPVQQDTLHFLHRSSVTLAESKAITDHIYWGGKFEDLMSLVQNHEVNVADFKFFIGYSGWGKGQLMDEMKEHSWIVCRGVKPEYIFDIDYEELWKTVLREMGGKYKMFSNYPTDPRLN